MGCGKYVSRATTIGKLFADAGEDDSVAREQQVLDDVVPGGETWFICGGPEVPVCPCGHMSDLLCDFPTGKRARCDLPLCADCAHEIGKNRHLCDIHFQMFKGAAKVDEIDPPPPSGPWKPTLVRATTDATPKGKR